MHRCVISNNYPWPLSIRIHRPETVGPPPPPPAVHYIFPIAAKHRCVISRKRKKREKKRFRKKVRAREKKNMIRKRLKGKKINKLLTK